MPSGRPRSPCVPLPDARKRREANALCIRRRIVILAALSAAVLVGTTGAAAARHWQDPLVVTTINNTSLSASGLTARGDAPAAGMTTVGNGLRRTGRLVPGPHRYGELGQVGTTRNQHARQRQTLGRRLPDARNGREPEHVPGAVEGPGR
jgi:hypothetical protein